MRLRLLRERGAQDAVTRAGVWGVTVALADGAVVGAPVLPIRVVEGVAAMDAVGVKLRRRLPGRHRPREPVPEEGPARDRREERCP